ncbi:hypothetical protein DRJ17_01160 [Candidatus Woesearchaeota archaeon]|nr:MAG: hypothetical protein DRJ17_01160 [Candidatus Woesearchaeota archaeon]
MFGSLFTGYIQSNIILIIDIYVVTSMLSIWGDNMHEKILREIGLSNNEAKIYLALLEYGSATACKIAEKSGVHRSNVYDALERLLEKGLVKYVIKGNVKVFGVLSPENLLSYVNQKSELLKKILPEMMLKHSLTEEKTRAYIHQGVSAFRLILQEWLKKKKPILVYGIPKNAIDLIGPWIEVFHNERIKKKIQMNHIYNDDAKERISFLNKLPYTAARFLNNKYESMVSTNICGDEVMLSLWIPPVIVIRITSSKIAESYRNYFNVLWNVARQDARQDD